MSLKEYASRKIRRDTAGNWSSNNPTPLQGEWCLETDTGNVKIGDGSTAWNDLGYRQQLPFTYTLTSNETHTLPAITGAPQTESVYWTGGGTYKLTLAVTDGATVGGETAGTWEGEGNGHILVESDGSNWQVREYEDSGSNSNGEWWKFIDKTMRQTFDQGTTAVTLNTTGNIYQSDVISIPLPKTFTTVSRVLPYNHAGGGVACWVGWINISTTTVSAYLLGSSSTTVGKVKGEAIGTWK